MKCFGENIICADDNTLPAGSSILGEAPTPRIKKGRGKPCPDIFLIAAHEILGRPVGLEEDFVGDEMKAARAKGLVFEDAIPGVEAGKRAGMNGERAQKKKSPFRLMLTVHTFRSFSCMGP